MEGRPLVKEGLEILAATPPLPVLSTKGEAVTLPLPMPLVAEY